MAQQGEATRAAFDADRVSEAERARKLGSVVGAPVRFGQGKAPKLDLYRSRDLPDNSTDVTIRSTGVRFEGLEVSDEVAAEILRILAREAAE